MKPKIFLAFPAYGRMNVSDTTASLFELGVTFGMNGLYGGFGTASHTDIGELRNVFLTTFYDRTTASHLLMVDADMKFRAALVIDMLKFDQPVVGAIYRKKSPKVEWVGSSIPGQVAKDGFLEVEGVGAGVLLIRRDAVARMIKKFPELIDNDPQDTVAAGLPRIFRAFDPVIKNGRPISEDLSFCHRWRSIGGKVWANVAHDIGHVGMSEFSGSYEQNLVPASNAA